ncbi:ABC transporter permease [Kordiimonas sp. SCSIO 12610]|uniref:MlaE family ABC transporter permease n=1 Tax=Kordiimonas sp. SCSIO 12610 TaxID=2829597 RepID=UPI00210B278C|nr:ABC transporter permease [Kordiimonas sp. SCSIO 12610]UTW54097.1 ABC transporter permease [Kordiimonas sp. SCSIO 12610]
MPNPLAIIGRIFLSALAEVGRIATFTGQSLMSIITPPIYWRSILSQMWLIGYNSLPVVGLTALFTGAALAQQIFVGGSRFNAESVVPGVVVIAIVRELGPVLGGLMVAGRVSSAMAAELGTMRVTEQIDALVTLSTDPFKYLIAPRLLAATITLPVLVLVANIIGVLGGYIIGTGRLGLNASTYLQVTSDFLEQSDVISSMVKAGVFGFIIALMGSYHGYNSRGGAQGVGKATTNAVVSAFITILLANLIITVIVFGGAS